MRYCDVKWGSESLWFFVCIQKNKIKIEKRLSLLSLCSPFIRSSKMSRDSDKNVCAILNSYLVHANAVLVSIATHETNISLLLHFHSSHCLVPLKVIRMSICDRCLYSVHLQFTADVYVVFFYTSNSVKGEISSGTQHQFHFIIFSRNEENIHHWKTNLYNSLSRETCLPYVLLTYSM